MLTMHAARFFIALCLSTVASTVAGAQALSEGAGGTSVDVELFLGVDVSGSMSSSELRLQRRGYADAFRSDDVINAISKGLTGRVVVMYSEWARNDAHKVIVPWTVISSAEEANAFADRLEAAEFGNMRNTSISGAIRYGMAQIDGNSFAGSRRVLDISGDGPNNQGEPVEVARDAAVAAGFTINGLPIMAEEARPGLWSYSIEDLDIYYQACVIGGPGAFMIPVREWDEFAEAVRRKIVLELAGQPVLPVIRTQFILETRPDADCLIGEKRRQLRERIDN